MLSIKFIISLIIFNYVSPAPSLNILVYSPIFGGSHSKFMGNIADTLTEAGHNVVGQIINKKNLINIIFQTFLVPVADVTRRHEVGVKLTKNVMIVDVSF